MYNLLNPDESLNGTYTRVFSNGFKEVLIVSGENYVANIIPNEKFKLTRELVSSLKGGGKYPFIKKQ